MMILASIWSWIQKSFPPPPSTDNDNSSDFIPFLFPRNSDKKQQQQFTCIGLVHRSYWDRMNDKCKHQHLLIYDPEHKAIRFNRDMEGSDAVQARTDALQSMLLRWKQDEQGFFDHALKGWRNEHVAVYDPAAESRLLFTMERSAMGIFGFLAQGVHMNALVAITEFPDDDDDDFKNDIQILDTTPSSSLFRRPRHKMWVAVRSAAKEHYPDHYDQLVAGGLVAGLGIRQNLEKEALEEAGANLTSPLVVSSLSPTGCVNCSQWLPLGRGLHREAIFIYDAILQPSFKPCNQDGEVASVELCSMPRLLYMMLVDPKRTFSPHAGLVVIDFWMRHGYLDPDTDPISYMRIASFLAQNMRLDD